jgi:hypothetical protein
MSAPYAYPYYSGVELAQEVAGRNRRAGYNTNRAQQTWLERPVERGKALAAMESYASKALNLPPGNISAHTRRSGTYVNAKYSSSTGIPRTTHFSAHTVNTSRPKSFIGPFHAKTETNGKEVYAARAVPAFYGNNKGLPTFGNRFVGVPGQAPVPRTISKTPHVMEELGHAYSRGLHEHYGHFGHLSQSGKGKKTKAKKRTRKSKTQKRKQHH